MPKPEESKEKFQEAIELRESDPEMSLQITESLLTRKEPIGIPAWDIYILQAKIYLRLRQINDAMHSAEKADSLFYASKTEHLEAAHSILAITNKDKGNLPKALYHYQLALKYSKDTLSRLNNLFNMAEISLAAGDTTGSLRYFQENIVLVNNIEPLDLRAYSYLRYANFLLAIKQELKKALSLFMKAIQIDSKLQQYQTAGFACSGAANIYSLFNQKDSSIWWFNKAIELQMKENNPLGLSDAYVSFGDFQFDSGNYERAQKLYETALPFSQNADYIPVLEHNLKRLSDTYEKNGDFKQSIIYLRRYNRLVDSLGREKWLGQLSDLQLKYESGKKDQQLSELRRMLKVSMQIPFLIMAIGLFALLYFTFVTLRKKKKVKYYSQKTSARTAVIVANEECQELWMNIQRSMDDEKVYCNPGITLTTLANDLHTNRTTLSKVINHYYGKSFNHFINDHRVEEACRLLRDTNKRNLSVEGIGQETGFKSRSAFYSAFVDVTGTTPACYRKKDILEN